jgi:hypothetical protein
VERGTAPYEAGDATGIWGRDLEMTQEKNQDTNDSFQLQDKETDHAQLPLQSIQLRNKEKRKSRQEVSKAKERI